MMGWMDVVSCPCHHRLCPLLESDSTGGSPSIKAQSFDLSMAMLAASECKVIQMVQKDNQKRLISQLAPTHVVREGLAPEEAHRRDATPAYLDPC